MQDEQTRVCQYCQSEISRNKKVCPVCHRKESHPVKVTLLCILGFFVAAILFFDLFALMTLFTPQSTLEQNQNTPSIERRYHNENHRSVPFSNTSETITFYPDEFNLENEVRY